MAVNAEVTPHVESSAPARRSLDRLGAFIAVLFAAQLLWLSGLAFGIYALVT